MTGQSFFADQFGDDTAIAFEMAFGADLTDMDGSGWTWTDVTDDVRNNPGSSTTVGRIDNVSQAGAAAMSFTLNNDDGLYTAGGPSDVGMAQNTPVRQRITLDGSTWTTRFEGYLDSANPVYDISANIKTVQVIAIGALGRLGGRKKPLASALRRAINISHPTLYWPMEDAAGSTTAVSAIPGILPLKITLGNPQFGVAGPGGSAGAVDFGQSNSQLEVDLLPASSATSWRFEISLIAPDDAGQLPMSFFTTGDIWNIAIQCVDNNVVNVHTTFLDTTTRDDAASVTVGDNAWHRLRFEVAKSGANTTYEMTIDGTSVLSVTLSGIVFGQPSTFRVGSSLGSGLSSGTRMAITQPVFWQPYASPVTVDTMAANDGYTGETADERLTRLCAEEGIALDLRGTSNVTMGPQSIAKLLDLLRECEAADHGVLYDGFGPGVGYQCRSDRYNADPALILDMGGPLEVDTFAPIFDKQAIKNLYTVSRKDGGSATYEQTDGPVGTDAIGVEDASITINIATDDPLIQHAGWLVGLGTVPGFRYPSVGLNLRAIPTRADDVLAVAIGLHATIQNPASKATDLPTDDIELVAEGCTETITANSWKVALNTSPFRPFRVFVLDVDELDDPDVFLAL